MTEFVAGALVATYFVVLIWIWRADHPRWYEAPSYIFWPVMLVISPFSRWAFQRWKYEYRAGTGPFNEGHMGWYLKPGRKHNDSWGFREVAHWVRSLRSE